LLCQADLVLQDKVILVAVELLLVDLQLLEVAVTLQQVLELLVVQEQQYQSLTQRLRHLQVLDMFQEVWFTLQAVAVVDLITVERSEAVALAAAVLAAEL
tara:strand:+ start:127 stop:426 length:300 start_codon:yes stop_codon:yes gene_type:complete